MSDFIKNITIWNLLGFVVSLVIAFDCFVLSMTFFATWSPLLAYSTGFSGAILNFFLYWKDSPSKLKQLYDDIRQQRNLTSISRISAIVSGLFIGIVTYSSYHETLSNATIPWMHLLPHYSVWIFAGCYFLGTIALYAEDDQSKPAQVGRSSFSYSWVVFSIAILAFNGFFVKEFLSVIVPFISSDTSLKTMTYVCLSLPILLNINSEYQYADGLAEWMGTQSNAPSSNQYLSVFNVLTVAMILLNSIPNGYCAIAQLSILNHQQLYYGFMGLIALCGLGLTYIKHQPAIYAFNIVATLCFVSTIIMALSPIASSYFIKGILVTCGASLSGVTMYKAIFEEHQHTPNIETGVKKGLSNQSTKPVSSGDITPDTSAANKSNTQPPHSASEQRALAAIARIKAASRESRRLAASS